ncbi:MAG: sugar kinase [Bacillota bacterium]
MDVVVVGELNPDLIFTGLARSPRLGVEQLAQSFSFTLGGSGAICAVTLSKLGLQVGFAGKVGDDVFGASCVEFLSRYRVDTARITVDASIRTGVTVSLSYPRDRLLVTYPGSIGELQLSDLDLDYILRGSHLHLSSYYLQKKLRVDVPALFEAAKGRGLSISLDTGWDPTETWDDDISQALEHVDIFLPNEPELCRITRRPTWDEGLSAIGEWMSPAATVVVKLGPGGAVARQGEREVRVPPYSIVPVDTTGAGDSFDAGFIYGFLKGKDLLQALTFANACGALSASSVGGTGGFESLTDVERFMTKNQEPRG